ncbi:LysR family transcriptional regulator [Sphingopyxis indica]|nr:LysR family transcriptional regulator [Sphingopyxis indica]
MDWDDLRTFLAIARHGTLSGAARALGVTQPTMGRRLAAMESRTGARLLQRLPGRFALTPLGQSVLSNAERIEVEVLSAERTITGRDVALEGVVRMTTVDTLAAQLVVPALAALQERHPGIIVELVPDTRSLSLSKREADIALRLSRFEGHEVVARKVGSLALGLYASPKWLEAEALVEARVITVLDDQAHLPEAKWLHAQFPNAEVALRSNSRDVQVWAAKSGIGIAAFACYYAEEEPGLVRLKQDVPNLTRDIWLGVHSDMRDMPRIRAVMDAVIKTLRDKKAALDPVH